MQAGLFGHFQCRLGYLDTFSAGWAIWTLSVQAGLFGHFQCRLGYLDTFSAGWAIYSWTLSVQAGLFRHFQCRLGYLYLDTFSAGWAIYIWTLQRMLGYLGVSIFPLDSHMDHGIFNMSTQCNLFTCTRYTQGTSVSKSHSKDFVQSLHRLGLRRTLRICAGKA